MYIYRKVFLSGENFKITFEEYNKAVKEKKYSKTEYSAWMQIKRQIDRNPTGKYFVTYNMQMQTLAIRCGDWRFGKFNVTSNCATGKDFFDYLACDIVTSNSYKLSPYYITDWVKQIKVPKYFNEDLANKESIFLTLKQFLAFADQMPAGIKALDTFSKEIDITFVDFPNELLENNPFTFQLFVDAEDRYFFWLNNTQTKHNISSVKFGEKEAIIPALKKYFVSKEKIDYPTLYAIELSAKSFERFYNKIDDWSFAFNNLREFIQKDSKFRVFYCPEFRTLSIKPIQSNTCVYTSTDVDTGDLTSFGGLIGYIIDGFKPIDFSTCVMRDTLNFHTWMQPLCRSDFNKTPPLEFNFKKLISFYPYYQFDVIRRTILAIDTIFSDFCFPEFEKDLSFRFIRENDNYALAICYKRKIPCIIRPACGVKELDNFVIEKFPENTPQLPVVYSHWWPIEHIKEIYERHINEFDEKTKKLFENAFVQDRNVAKIIYSPNLQVVSIKLFVDKGEGPNHLREVTLCNTDLEIGNYTDNFFIDIALELFITQKPILAGQWNFILDKYCDNFEVVKNDTDRSFTLTLLKFIKFAKAAPDFRVLNDVARHIDAIFSDFLLTDLPRPSRIQFTFTRSKTSNYYTLTISKDGRFSYFHPMIFTIEEFDKFVNDRASNKADAFIDSERGISMETYAYSPSTVTAPINANTIAAGTVRADSDSTQPVNPFGDIEFGPLNSSRVALSPYGLAIYRPADEKWVSYDRDKNSIFDTTILHFKVPNLLYLVPVPRDKVQAGDVIMHLGHMCFVTCVSEQVGIDVVDPLNGEYRCILPAKSPFGFDFVTKVINLFDYKSADADHPFGDMLPLMMMAQGNIDNNTMLAMMMMGDHGTAYDDMMPFLLMNQSGGGANQNLPMLLWMMNKKRG